MLAGRYCSAASGAGAGNRPLGSSLGPALLCLRAASQFRFSCILAPGDIPRALH